MDKLSELQRQALETQLRHLKIKRGRIVGDKAKKFDPVIKGLEEALEAQPDAEPE